MRGLYWKLLKSYQVYDNEAIPDCSLILSKSLRENNEKKNNTADILPPTHLSRDQTETSSGRKEPVFVIKHCLIEPYLSLTRTQVRRKFAVMSHSGN